MEQAEVDGLLVPSGKRFHDRPRYHPDVGQVYAEVVKLEEFEALVIGADACIPVDVGKLFESIEILRSAATEQHHAVADGYPIDVRVGGREEVEQLQSMRLSG